MYSTDLGHQSVRALQFIDERSQTVAELADRLRCAHNTASEIAKRLTLRALVQKNRRSNDERVVDLSITDGGRRVLGEHVLPDRQKLANCLKKLSDDEYASIAAAFELLVVKLNDEPQ